MSFTRQRRGDGLGGGGHRQAHAESHDDITRQDGKVAAVDRDEDRHEGQSGTAQEYPGRHRQTNSDPGRQSRGEDGAGYHQHEHRHEREGGDKTRPAEHRLEVGVENHEDPCRHAEHRE